MLATDFSAPAPFSWPNRPFFRLKLLGDSAATAACAAMVRESGDFFFDPLPDARYELYVYDEIKRDRVLADLLAHPIPGAFAYELHIKEDVRWKLIAADADEAIRIMEVEIEACGGEIEPMDKPFLPASQWNPLRVPTVWIPEEND